jgi:hypothetical protein
LHPQYPASLGSSGFTKSSVETGIDDVLIRLEQQHKLCPEKKFALVGSTIGADVIRGAIPYLDIAIHPKILAITLFSDAALRLCSSSLPPLLQGRLFESCIVGDTFCDRQVKSFNSLADANIPADFAPWLVYGEGSIFQKEAAEFIVAAFQGKPLVARVNGTQTIPDGQPAPVIGIQ